MPSDPKVYGRIRKGLHGLSSAILLAVVALAPLPFGLTAPLPIAIVCIGLAISLLAADFRPLERAHILRLLPALIAVTAYFAVAFIQVHPSGSTIGGPAPIWREAAGLLEIPMPAIPSWSVAGPWAALGPSIAFTLALVRSAVLCADRHQAARLLGCVIVSGLAYAVYGIVAHLTEPDMLLWRPKTAYLDAVTGTFVNRNTAATYWGSCAIVCLSVALGQIRGVNSGAVSVAYRRPVIVASLAGLGLCLVALAMTGSRAGTVLTFGGLALAGGLWLTGAETHRRSRWSKAVLGLAALLLIVQVLGGIVANRVREHGVFDERRATAYGDTLAIISEHPWLGVGLGNFAVVFPRYRSATLGSAGIWDRAHSTPLEMAAEMGLPVTILIATSCLIGVYGLLAGCIRRRRDRFIPIASAGVAALGIAHSSVDFSLQIAGYGVVFAAIVGCGLAQSVSTRASGFR